MSTMYIVYKFWEILLLRMLQLKRLFTYCIAPKIDQRQPHTHTTLRRPLQSLRPPISVLCNKIGHNLRIKFNNLLINCKIVVYINCVKENIILYRTAAQMPYIRNTKLSKIYIS